MGGGTFPPIDWLSLGLLAAAFLAAALAIEGLVLLWQQTRSPAVQRLRRRLRAWLPDSGEPGGRLGGRRGGSPAWLQGNGVEGTHLQGLARLLVQAGGSWSPPAFLWLCAVLALLAALGVLGWQALGPPWPGPAGGSASGTLTSWVIVLAAALAAGLAPVALLTLQSRRRIKAVVEQLPDALDLLSRALRSGHGFSAAMQMVAQDGPKPLAEEFGRVEEVIALGGDADAAFDSLAQRVPVSEMRFFVMAVRLQRQTGGQLAEVLGNIAHLVRQRQQLQDKVQALTAEGRLSAKILGALPPVTAGVLLLVRPEFIALLWRDPAGLQLLQASVALMALGGVWLWQLTRIRV